MEVINSHLMLVSNMPYKMFHLSNRSHPLALQFPLLVFNIPTRASSKLTLSGFPSTKELKPHGISFDKHTDTLAVVNHAIGEGESRVELFHLQYYKKGGTEEVARGEAEEVKAQYVTSSEGFPAAGTINDVVLTAPDTMFVTEWMQHGVPSSPKDMEQRSMVGKIQQDLMHILGIAVYRLHKCTAPVMSAEILTPAPWSCQVMKTLPSMNGIATTADRSLLAVVMISMKGINFYELPSMTLRAKVQLPILVDNLVLSEEESGRIPFNGVQGESNVDLGGAPGETVDVWYGGGIVRGVDYLKHITDMHGPRSTNSSSSSKEKLEDNSDIPSAVVRVAFNRDTGEVTHRIVKEAKHAGCWSVAAKLPAASGMAIGSFCKSGMYVCSP